jgi:hypothetical protein
VAPVDFHGSVLTDTPYLVVLPAADGDVQGNDGAKIFDRAKVATAGDWFKSQTYIYGACHNFFNSEWLQDDGNGPNRLTRDQQERLLRSLTRAFFDRTLNGKVENDDVLRGVTPVADEPVDMFPSFVAKNERLVDDFENHDETVNTLTGAVTQRDFALFGLFDFEQSAEHTYNDSFYNQTRGLVATWTQGAPRFVSAIPKGTDADMTGFDVLSLRIAQIADTLNQPIGDDFQFTIELVDANGATASFANDALGAVVPAPYARDLDTKTMPRTVRMPLSCFRAADPTAPALALANIAEVRLHPARAQGALAIDHIAFSE